MSGDGHPRLTGRTYMPGMAPSPTVYKYILPRRGTPACLDEGDPLSEANRTSGTVFEPT